MQHSGAARIPIGLAAIALAAVVFAVFFPILGYEFVNLDVGQHVVENPHIRGLSWENLKQIFTSWCTTSYYPVRSLSLAVDYQLWGLHPAGFKLTGLLIHLANVLLVFWLVLRLFPRPTADGASSAWREVSLAAFSAGVFAVHPVVVEPVAWVAGREELLMTLGALGCLHFHLTARRLAEAGGKTRRVLACHALAAFSCAAACLSNAAAAVIPLLITAWDVLTLAPPKFRKILYGTSALWAIGLAAIVLKKLGQFRESPYEVAAFSAERLALALNVYWLNLKTLVWPTPLAIFYPRVEPAGFGDAEVILGGIALGLTCALLWAVRRQKLALFGLLWFGIALAPSAQIMVHHIHRADRFLYLPLSGLAVAVAMGLGPLAGALKRRAAVAAVIVTGLLGLVLLGKLGADQVRTWQNAASMWENCVRVDPNNTDSRCAFADRLLNRREFRRALEQYEEVLRLDPGHGKASVKLAWLLVCCDDKALRDYDRALWLAQRAFEHDPAFFRALGRVRSAVAEVRAKEGDFGRAIEGYRLALEADPGNRPATLQLALLLATCGDKRLRDPRQAVQLAERACLLAKQPGPEELRVLAVAYAEAGQDDMAVRTAQKAVELAQAAGDAKLLDELRERLRVYKERLRNRQGP